MIILGQQDDSVGKVGELIFPHVYELYMCCAVVCPTREKLNASYLNDCSPSTCEEWRQEQFKASLKILQK